MALQLSLICLSLGSFVMSLTNLIAQILLVKKGERTISSSVIIGVAERGFRGSEEPSRNSMGSSTPASKYMTVYTYIHTLYLPPMHGENDIENDHNNL